MTKQLRYQDASGVVRIFKPGVIVKTWDNDTQQWFYGRVEAVTSSPLGVDVNWLGDVYEAGIPPEVIEVVPGRIGKVMYRILSRES